MQQLTKCIPAAHSTNTKYKTPSFTTSLLMLGTAATAIGTVASMLEPVEESAPVEPMIENSTYDKLAKHLDTAKRMISDRDGRIAELEDVYDSMCKTYDKTIDDLKAQLYEANVLRNSSSLHDELVRLVTKAKQTPHEGTPIIYVSESMYKALYEEYKSGRYPTQYFSPQEPLRFYNCLVEVSDSCIEKEVPVEPAQTSVKEPTQLIEKEYSVYYSGKY